MRSVYRKYKNKRKQKEIRSAIITLSRFFLVLIFEIIVLMPGIWFAACITRLLMFPSMALWSAKFWLIAYAWLNTLSAMLCELSSLFRSSSKYSASSRVAEWNWSISFLTLERRLARSRAEWRLFLRRWNSLLCSVRTSLWRTRFWSLAADEFTADSDSRVRERDETTVSRYGNISTQSTTLSERAGIIEGPVLEGDGDPDWAYLPKDVLNLLL